MKLSYRGLDDVVRTTYIEFSLAPLAISATQAEFKLQLRRGGSAELSIEIGAQEEDCAVDAALPRGVRRAVGGHA